MFKKILLAVDGSEHSFKATEYAISLAKKYEATIDAVNVIEPEPVRKAALKMESQSDIEEKQREMLEPIREKLDEANIIFGTHLLHGEPGPTLLKFADEREVDCIVIGSRGLNPLQTIFLGSVSTNVAKKSSCPVLIVK